jgi:hypothetical protein
MLPKAGIFSQASLSPARAAEQGWKECGAAGSSFLIDGKMVAIFSGEAICIKS